MGKLESDSKAKSHLQLFSSLQVYRATPFTVSKAALYVTTSTPE